MEDTRFDAEFCQKTVLGFCRFPEGSLSALAKDLSLSMNQTGLLHCQKYFRGKEMRDPTVGELKFLAALAARMSELPAAITLDTLHFADGADARVFADVIRQREVLGKTDAPSLADMLHTVTAYLARSGRRATKKAAPLHVGEAAYIAARAAAPQKALQVGNACAARLPHLKSSTRKAGDLLLALSPAEGQSLANTVENLFAQAGHLSTAPLALIGREGLGVHLATLPMGVELDLMPVADFDASYGAPALLDACKGTLLLSCPQEVAMEMLRENAQLTLIGRLTADELISVRYGIQPLLALNRKFLATFRATKRATVTVPARTKKPFTDEIAFSEDASFVLCGAVLDGSPEEALCHLLTAAYGHGADMLYATLGTVLSLPLAADERALANAISLMLPLHRFEAELALPTESLRIITAPVDAAPSLTVFLTAPKGCTHENTEMLKSSLYKGDFATARSLIYPHKAEK